MAPPPVTCQYLMPPYEDITEFTGFTTQDLFNVGLMGRGHLITTKEKERMATAGEIAVLDTQRLFWAAHPEYTYVLDDVSDTLCSEPMVSTSPLQSQVEEQRTVESSHGAQAEHAREDSMVLMGGILSEEQQLSTAPSQTQAHRSASADTVELEQTQHTETTHVSDSVTDDSAALVQPRVNTINVLDEILGDDYQDSAASECSMHEAVSDRQSEQTAAVATVAHQSAAHSEQADLTVSEVDMLSYVIDKEQELADKQKHRAEEKKMRKLQRRLERQEKHDQLQTQQVQDRAHHAHQHQEQDVSPPLSESNLMQHKIEMREQLLQKHKGTSQYQQFLDKANKRDEHDEQVRSARWWIRNRNRYQRYGFLYRFLCDPFSIPVETEITWPNPRARHTVQDVIYATQGDDDYTVLRQKWKELEQYQQEIRRMEDMRAGRHHQTLSDSTAVAVTRSKSSGAAAKGKGHGYPQPPPPAQVTDTFEVQVPVFDPQQVQQYHVQPQQQQQQQLPMAVMDAQFQQVQVQHKPQHHHQRSSHGSARQTAVMCTVPSTKHGSKHAASTAQAEEQQKPSVALVQAVRDYRTEPGYHLSEHRSSVSQSQEEGSSKAFQQWLSDVEVQTGTVGGIQGLKC